MGSSKATNDESRRGSRRLIETFGDNFRRERLAELADLNPRTVQKIEAGDITILVTTLLRLRAAIREIAV